MGSIIKYLLRGLLVVVPIALTLWVLVKLFLWVDGLIQVPGSDRYVPGLGVAVGVLVILLIGVLASNLIARQLLAWSEGVFTRLPLVKLVYTSIKDLVGAFVSEEKRFDKAVLVRLGDGLDARVLGFQTRDDLTRFGLADDVSVYFPQAYNFAGHLLVVPRSHVTVLDVPPADVMAFVISGGVAGLKPRP
jgi:uncharacterized membrane protein